MSQKYECKFPSMLKSELADIIGVSRQTLGNWLNGRYFNELEKLGYTKNLRILEPNIIAYLSEKLCFDLKDTE